MRRNLKRRIFDGVIVEVGRASDIRILAKSGIDFAPLALYTLRDRGHRGDNRYAGQSIGRHFVPFPRPVERRSDQRAVRRRVASEVRGSSRCSIWDGNEDAASLPRQDMIQAQIGLH